MVSYLNLVELVSGKLPKSRIRNSKIVQVELGLPLALFVAIHSILLKFGSKLKIGRSQFTVELSTASSRLSQKSPQQGYSRDGEAQFTVNFCSMQSSFPSRVRLVKRLVTFTEPSDIGESGVGKDITILTGS